MRDLLRGWETALAWSLFFATAVYGHVALKFAVGHAPSASGRQVLLSVMTTVRGWSALLAWGVSCLLWAVVLSRHSLMTANAVSALRYVLICLAARLLLGEALRPLQVAGIALIALGILLVR